MPSAASNRYQSRLFNFVYKRSRSLTKQLTRAWHNVTSWIAPVVTYPAQVLHATVHNSLPQLPKADNSDSPPAVDTPVKNVLLLVAEPSIEDLALTPSSQPPNFLGWLGNKLFPKPKTTSLCSSEQPLAPKSVSRPLVRGIASYIPNRNLVLVTPQNEILDILSNRQQEKLQACIIDEVARYWRFQGLLASSVDATKQLQIPERQPLSVRLFINIANWLQVASKDSFDERGELVFATKQAIDFLDRNIAQFETNHLAAVAANPAKTNKLQIQALIWAAIDYFFGDRSIKKVAPNQQENKVIQLPNSSKGKQKLVKAVNPSLLTFSPTKLADPWLTINELFGETKTVTPSAIAPNSQLPESLNLTRSHQILNKYSLRSLVKRIQQKKSSVSLAKKSLSPTQIAVKQQSSTRLTFKLPSIPKREEDIVLNLGTSVASHASNQGDRIAHNPDWIETEATTMGYIKHPLEQLLAWLDSAMLWLEDLLVKFWQQIQKLLIGK